MAVEAYSFAILHALVLDPQSLKSVRVEKTAVLPDLS
jgi:hypothetical protein